MMDELEPLLLSTVMLYLKNDVFYEEKNMSIILKNDSKTIQTGTTRKYFFFILINTN